MSCPATEHDCEIAAGMADNFRASLVLALQGPLVIAPTMDVTCASILPQTNRHTRQRRHIIEPETGACQRTSGRAVFKYPRCWSMQSGISGAARLILPGRVLVTAGPTRMMILSATCNWSRQDVCVAQAAAARGESVVLVAGPVHLPTPNGVERIDVATAREMADAVLGRFDACDVLIMAAAVADFAPASVAGSKIKRDAISGDRMAIECVKNPDILRAAAERRSRQVMVGFALETDNGLDHARAKRAAKHLDLIVLNDPQVECNRRGCNVIAITATTLQQPAPPSKAGCSTRFWTGW
jgi:phosphopantothenoylcysteine decarboxylase/phosphopantothenate--cysteine ligase